MKVVIFCGGQGLRMREASEVAPKPMIPIGNRPVLWHVMKYYAHFGFTDFVLCLGYKAEAIKQFFLTYNEALTNDFVLSDGGASVHVLKTDIHNWNITFVDTGLHACIGERLRAVATPAPRRRDVPRQLRRHADRRRPPRDDLVRQGCERDRELPGGAAELQLPRRLDGRARARRRHPGRDALGRLDQRRLLRVPQRDPRPAAARGGSRRASRFSACSPPISCWPSATTDSGRRWTR